MRIYLLILSACFAVYTLVVYQYSDPLPAQQPSAEILAGWNVWQEKNCQSCHQLYGLGGYLGPDLTNTASQKGSPYMRTFIQNGTGRMPDFHLSETEINNVIAFLSWVDRSGSSKVKNTSVHWTGTYTFPSK